MKSEKHSAPSFSLHHTSYVSRFTRSVAFCYSKERQAVAGHPPHRVRITDGRERRSHRNEESLVSVGHSRSDISSNLVAPALLITENETIILEVVWLTRSVRGFLFQ
jgi:hypothetical protein